jgi:hypothetical protein
MIKVELTTEHLLKFAQSKEAIDFKVYYGNDFLTEYFMFSGEFYLDTQTFSIDQEEIIIDPNLIISLYKFFTDENF